MLMSTNLNSISDFIWSWTIFLSLLPWERTVFFFNVGVTFESVNWILCQTSRVTLFQTQQLGAARKHPGPETVGCFQQEVSVVMDTHRGDGFWKLLTHYGVVRGGQSGGSGSWTEPPVEVSSVFILEFIWSFDIAENKRRSFCCVSEGRGRGDDLGKSL